jgi:hypothetical protein
MEFDRTERGESENLGFGNEVPPLISHVIIIFDQMELPEKDALKFYRHFEERDWHTKTGVPIKNWKHILDQWVWDIKKGNR